MIKGNFLGAAIVAIIYTVYILINPRMISEEIQDKYPILFNDFEH